MTKKVKNVKSSNSFLWFLGKNILVTEVPNLTQFRVRAHLLHCFMLETYVHVSFDSDHMSTHGDQTKTLSAFSIPRCSEGQSDTNCRKCWIKEVSGCFKTKYTLSCLIEKGGEGEYYAVALLSTLLSLNLAQ